MAVLTPGAYAEAFSRYQTTSEGPYQVSNSFFAEAHSDAGGGFPHISNAHAVADTARVRSLSQAGGADAGPRPPQMDIAAGSTALHTSNWVVVGRSRRGLAPIEVTLDVHGVLETQNYGGAPRHSNLLTAEVLARLSLGSSLETEPVQAVAKLGPEVRLPNGEYTPLESNGPWEFTRIDTDSTTQRWEVHHSNTIPSSFSVVAGEIFSVEALLVTNAYAHAPYEIYSTADFYTGDNGIAFTLSTPGAMVVPAVDAEYDLGVVITDDPDPVVVGENLTYTVTVTNHGPETAQYASVTQVLPSIVEFVSATGGVTPDAGELFFDLGAMQPGESRSLEVVVRPRVAGNIRTAASAFAAGTDANEENDEAVAESTAMARVSDLSVSIDDLHEPVRADEPIPYAITVTNHGPMTATELTLDQVLPGGFFAYSSAPGELHDDGDRLNIELGELAPGESVTIQTGFYAPFLSRDAVASQVTVSSSATDPNLSNNSDIEETTVNWTFPEGYQFTRIDDGNVIQVPSINNSGEVAYRVNDPDGSKIRRGNGASTTLIIEGTLNSLFYGFYQSINDAGDVAFVSRPADVLQPDAIMIGNGHTLTTVANTSATLTEFPHTPTINNAGLTAFVGQHGNSGQGVYIGDGVSAPQLILATSDTYSHFNWPYINDEGKVAFTATRLDGGEEVLLWDQGSLITIADSTGIFDSFQERVSMNDAGVIAFAATCDDGSTGIFIVEGGAIRTYVDSSGAFSHFSGHSINNHGKVAFHGTLDTGLFGIYCGPDPMTDKVIVRGDSFFGQAVSYLAFDRQGLNDTGQVAFYINLSNGGALIVRADPDGDADGVPDTVEQAAPGGGDGNGDGVSDHLQQNVTSLPSVVDGSFITVASPPGTTLINVVSRVPASGGPPAGAFPLGAIDFSVQGIVPGQAVNVEVIAPGDLTSHQYFKYRYPNWYSFSFDGTTGAQSTLDTIHGNLVTKFDLHFVDGNSRGDHDGLANGRIIDPGGPAVDTEFPTVEGVVVQNGMMQRSYVDRLAIDFSEQMNLAELIADGSITSAVKLVNLGVQADSEADSIVPLSASQFSYESDGESGLSRLAWSLDALASTGGSLDDGFYQLVLDASLIRDVAGNVLQGNANGQTRENYVFSFHRLQGDVDGNSIVDAKDMAIVNAALGSSLQGPVWNANADLDRDSRVTVRDRLVVARATGRAITPPVADVVTSDHLSRSAAFAAHDVIDRAFEERAFETGMLEERMLEERASERWSTRLQSIDTDDWWDNLPVDQVRKSTVFSLS